MRMTGVSVPTTSFTIPPSAPEPVQAAWAELVRIGILYDDTRDDLKDAKQALTAAQALDVRAAVAATSAGQRSDRPD